MEISGKSTMSYFLRPLLVAFSQALFLLKLPKITLRPAALMQMPHSLPATILLHRTESDY